VPEPNRRAWVDWTAEGNGPHIDIASGQVPCTCYAALPRANVRRSIVLCQWNQARQPNLYSSHALKGFHP